MGRGRKNKKNDESTTGQVLNDPTLQEQDDQLEVSAPAPKRTKSISKVPTNSTYKDSNSNTVVAKPKGSKKGTTVDKPRGSKKGAGPGRPKGSKNDTRLAIQRGTPRRSTRIQNASPSSKQHGEPIVKNIELSDDDSDKEHNQHLAMEKNVSSIETVDRIRCMEEKINHLLVLLEQRNESESVIPEDEMYIENKNQSLANMKSEMIIRKYKRMYMDGLLKIEDLKAENCELRNKCEAAINKLEGFEKGQSVLSEAIQKMKDASLASTLSKTTQAVLDLSSPPQTSTQDFCSPAASPEPNCPAPKGGMAVSKKNTRMQGCLNLCS